MNKLAIGVDLGGTNLRIAAVDDQGKLVEKVTLGTQVSLGRDHVIGEMCNAIQSMSDKYKSSAALLGIGIGVPGIIDMQTGLVRESPNLPDWVDYPARAAVEQRLKTVVILENDANVAALGEKWLGAAKDFSDMAMLTLGTGVGGGIVLGGKIWRGANGMAGELGHSTVEPDGHLCGCGNHGCLEQYASATAMVRLAREAIAKGDAPALARAIQSDPEFSAKSIYNLAIQGDEAARRIFRYVGRCLGIVLSTMVNSLNLPIYVIGGGASSAWEAFSPSIFEELRLRSFVYAATAPDDPLAKHEGASAHVKPGPGPKTIITRALLGSDAGLYGAARLPMLTDK
ncbi:MAG TPA: ROK family protein [Terriglobales bacterium]|jgi:glucokinase|nr:ROK family protein [Terriglobales bacterium]